MTAIENPQAAWELYILLEHQISSYYPIPAVSLSSSDPPNITPEIKILQRRKTGFCSWGGLTRLPSALDE